MLARTFSHRGLSLCASFFSFRLVPIESVFQRDAAATDAKRTARLSNQHARRIHRTRTAHETRFPNRWRIADLVAFLSTSRSWPSPSTSQILFTRRVKI